MALSEDLRKNLVEAIKSLTDSQLEQLYDGAKLEFITIGRSRPIKKDEANILIKGYKDKIEKSMIFGVGGIRPIRKLLHGNLCEDSTEGVNNCYPSYTIDVDFVRNIIDQPQEEVKYLCIYPALRSDGDSANFTMVLLGLNVDKKPVLKTKSVAEAQDEIYDYIDPCRPCPLI